MKLALKNLSIDQMLAEIKRRNRMVAKLNRRRAALLVKVASTEDEIKQLGGEIKMPASRGAGKTGARRPRNHQSLADAMAGVMSKEKAMKVSDLEKAVLQKGYQTTSASFRTIIFQALAKDKRFKKAGRGQYVLK